MATAQDDNSQIPIETVARIEAALDRIRREIRSRAGLLAGFGGQSPVDRLIDTSLAPLVLVAANGGFDSLDDAIETVAADLSEAVGEGILSKT